MIKDRKGQSTLEYIILVTAIIVVIIALVMGSNSPFSKGLNDTYGRMLNSTNVMSNRLADVINH